MHLHQSIIDSKTRKTIFSNPDGTRRAVLRTYRRSAKILPGAMSLFAPNVNSYRRISRHSAAPINVHWGYDNRTAGLRVPMSGPEARRVENRVGGAERQSLPRHSGLPGLRYLGMVEGLKPSEPISAAPTISPSPCRGPWRRHLRRCANPSPWWTCSATASCWPLRRSKEAEYETFAQVISSWEREHLLLTFDETVPERGLRYKVPLTISNRASIRGRARCSAFVGWRFWALGCALALSACGDRNRSRRDRGPGRHPRRRQQQSLNLYIWSDYLAANTLPDFEKQTGIKVHVSYFDTNETLETKLLAGNSGFDVVVPTASYFERQIKAGVYLAFDKSKLPN